MEYHEISFHYKKTFIYTTYVQPKEVKGLVVLVHGFGEHLGRYTSHVIPMLVKTGFAVVAYDNEGHGKSDGKRGHCQGYNTLLDILDTVISKAASIFPNVPLWLYGHSMGGNLVLNYELRKTTNLNGIIATSPYLRLAFNPPAWKMKLGKLMMRLLPSITLPSGLDPAGISRIPEEVEKYIADPLVQDKVSPTYSFPIMEAGEWAIEHAGALAIPCLLLHGTMDPIIDHKATVQFHENASKTTLELFEGGYHELHNDLCEQEMLAYIQNWLQKQV